MMCSDDFCFPSFIILSMERFSEMISQIDLDLDLFANKRKASDSVELLAGITMECFRSDNTRGQRSILHKEWIALLSIYLGARSCWRMHVFIMYLV